MTEPLRPDHDPATDPTTVSPVPATAGPGPEPVTPIATAPVLEPPSAAPAGTPPPSRSGPARWLAAAIAIVAVVGVSAIATLALTGSSSTATVMGYVPADSVMYAEMRLDLPGDQRQQVGEFLSAFPGFADQAALDTKLDEVLDRLIADGTNGEQTFTKDIKPWFDGELAVAAGPLPQGSGAADVMAAAKDARALMLLSIKDEALARAWFDAAMTASGVTGTTQTQGTTQVTVFADPDMPGTEAAFAIVGGEVAIAGDLDSVTEAIDTNGDSGFADDPDVKAALDALDGDHLGFVFVDVETLMERVTTMAEGMAPAAVDGALLELVPDWFGGRLRVESDALVMDGVTPHVDGAPGPDANDANGVAGWAPPTTVALTAGNDYGATLLETLELAGDAAGTGEMLDGLEGAANIVGGLEGALGWMGDTGVVVADGGEALEGGVISLPTDPAAAQQLLTTLRSFATLGGGAAGITVTDEPYAGTTITVIDLGSAANLIGMAGALSGEALPSVPPTGLPEGNVQLAYAATDGVVVIGSGPEFVKSVLDAGSGESLADTARYRDLVARVGAEHTAVAFLDITALRGALEGLLAEATAADRAEYEGSIKPFLTPFDAFAAATTTASDVDGQHAIVTVK